MANTNSTYEKNSRYVHGGTTEVTDSTLEWWERNKFQKDITDFEYVLEKTYEHRPDKLADVIYDDDRLFWVILQYNAILDIQEEFVEGLALKIPTKERVLADFLNNRNGGIPSKRIL